MNIKAVRGTKDIFGKDSEKYDYVVKIAGDYFEKYGFSSSRNSWEYSTFWRNIKEKKTRTGGK